MGERAGEATGDLESLGDLDLTRTGDAERPRDTDLAGEPASDPRIGSSSRSDAALGEPPSDDMTDTVCLAALTPSAASKQSGQEEAGLSEFAQNITPANTNTRVVTSTALTQLRLHGFGAGFQMMSINCSRRCESCQTHCPATDSVIDKKTVCSASTSPYAAWHHVCNSQLLSDCNKVQLQQLVGGRIMLSLSATPLYEQNHVHLPVCTVMPTHIVQIHDPT